MLWFMVLGDVMASEDGSVLEEVEEIAKVEGIEEGGWMEFIDG
jgi:hypothetical protein